MLDAYGFCEVQPWLLGVHQRGRRRHLLHYTAQLREAVVIDEGFNDVVLHNHRHTRRSKNPKQPTSSSRKQLKLNVLRATAELIVVIAGVAAPLNSLVTFFEKKVFYRPVWAGTMNLQSLSENEYGFRGQLPNTGIITVSVTRAQGPQARSRNRARASAVVDVLYTGGWQTKMTLLDASCFAEMQLLREGLGGIMDVVDGGIFCTPSMLSAINEEGFNEVTITWDA
ncbi:hypothetical protein HDU96_000296 [Phlyctochytrium bullatum]|nr:hypothetical protein HDU96_000296 [Phlyctochytrium bullatum]